MDWDDLKILLALARKGSARGAAQLLGVSNSTVTRRLDEMERQLQSRLFDRTPDGFRLTGAGEQLLPTAEHVEELVMGAERKITGEDQELHGVVRITMPMVHGLGFMVERLARFADDFPQIELELKPAYEALDLSRREADIAIRVMPAGVSPNENLIGRPIAALTASTYVHRDLLVSDLALGEIPWVGHDADDRSWVTSTQYPMNRIRHSIFDIGLRLEAVKARMGMAFLPCFIVQKEPEIVRMPGAEVVHEGDLWVLTHKDLRLSARMRIVREMIAEEFALIAPQMDSRLRPVDDLEVAAG